MTQALDLDAARAEPAASCPTSAPSEAPIFRYGVNSVLAGKYRLDALLGEGAMGAVWQATNLLLDSSVAIKLIRADLDGGEFRERLQLEARAAAGLGHPAIVRVFDVGETDRGDPFIVMELLQGGTLAQLLSGGRLTAVKAVRIILPVVDALAAAHARGIVHRDLKPDNLLISLEAQSVQPKIVDFGIAKLNGLRGEANKLGVPCGEYRKLTAAGALVGSPDYMSPEQAMGRDDVDYRTDIWSICVVLYEAMTGQMPFSAPNGAELLRAIIEDEPPSVVELAAGDERLWEIVRIGLSKDRLTRYGSMSALGRALAGWLLSHGVSEDVCGTSLESKWFGRVGDRPSRGSEGRPPRGDGPRESPAQEVPTTRPPANHGRSFVAFSTLKGSARKQPVRAAAVAFILVGAIALASCLLPLRRGAAKPSAASSPGVSTEQRVSALTRRETPIVPEGIRMENPLPPPPPPVEPNSARLADTPPLPKVARQKLAGAYTGASTNEARSAQLGSPGAPIRKANPASVSGADLDLIAPY